MSGILLDVNRLAARNKLTFRRSRRTSRCRAPATSQQPLAVVVQGRFGNISQLPRRHPHARLGPRDSASTPAAGSTRSRRSTSPPPIARAKFPFVKAAVTLNAYSFSAPVPATPPLTRPRLPTRPRAGRSRQERPPDGQAKPQELAAAKAKKQKIILIVGGVLLLAVAAFQGPKLMKGGGSSCRSARRRATPSSRSGDTRCRARSRPPRSRARRSLRALPCRGPQSSRSRRASSRRSRSSRSRIRSSSRRARRRSLTPRHLRPIGTARARRDPARRRRPAQPARRPPADQDAGRTGRAGTDRLRDDQLRRRSRSRCRSRTRSRRPRRCSSSAR